jgi:pyrroloquinoline quinone (PQQ) biosynthesis protein C
MRKLGMDVDAALSAPPSPTVAEIMGTLHFWVMHTHPVAAVGYFYFAERNVANVETIDHMASAAGVPPTALKTFYRHASIDIAHGRELGELVDSLALTTAHQDLLALSTSTVIRQLGRRTEKLLLQAERSAAVPKVRSHSSA